MHMDICLSVYMILASAIVVQVWNMMPKNGVQMTRYARGPYLATPSQARCLVCNRLCSEIDAQKKGYKNIYVFVPLILLVRLVRGGVVLFA